MMKLLPLLIGAGLALWIFNISKPDKRAQLAKDGLSTNILSLMSDAEVNDTYTWVYDYALPDNIAGAPADLRERVLLIRDKYDILN